MIRTLSLAAALIAAVPSYAQSAPAHAQLSDPEGEAVVIGSIHRITSSVYGKEQIVTVRLPRGYSGAANKSYPVVFALDGGPDQDFEILAGIAAEAEFSTSFEPFILVGIKTEDRYKQLTPEMTRLPQQRLKENFGDRIVPGGAETFRDYLRRDVLPWAIGRYRTGRRVLTGTSLAGLFVLDTFLEQPEMFDDYIALTPSLWWDDGRIVDEAPEQLASHRPSGRRLYFTMGDEGIGNRMGAWLSQLVATFEKHSPEGLKWAFVDRSGSEEHRTMAMISLLDAMRTLYLTPARSGSPLTLIYDDFKKPRYTPEARANIDGGPCTRKIAEPVTFEEKNRRERELFGMCVLMKPGSKSTAGNMKPADFGRGK